MNMCKSRETDLLAKFMYLLGDTKIHELRDLTKPLNHPTQLCQDKFTIKDVKLRISIIISSCLKGVVKP